MGLDSGLQLIIVLVAALAGGMLARLLRLPVIVGYLVGGIAIGPFGFALVQDMVTIESLANIGVILLLFTIGLEFSLKELKRMGRVAILGGIAQIVLTAAVGLLLGKTIGIPLTGAIFFGFLIALSSTMVVLKLLMERGDLDTSHGRIMLGILLVQDLSVVPVIVVMPALGGNVEGLWVYLGIAFLKAIAFLGVMLVLGFWAIPWFLGKVAGQRSRELFLLTVVVLALAAAFGTYFVGLSAAFGAFTAGLLISQSSYARQAFADIMPLRDTFAALFLVSLGMLANLHFVGGNLATVGLVVAIIIVSKFIICAIIPTLFRYSRKTSLYTAAGLIQVGEFSFILAKMGVDEGLFSDYLYSLIVTSAIITILLTPISMGLVSLIYNRLSQKKFFARLLSAQGDPEWQMPKLEMTRHAVICGYGSIGRRLATVLERRKYLYLVIELDPKIISELRSLGIPCIYGDASNPEILKHAHLEKARVLVSTIPDTVAIELTVRNAQKINPKLDIIARLHRDEDTEKLKNIGAAELVQPFFETSLEVVRHTLHRLGLSSMEIQYILSSLREGRTPPQ